MSVLINLTLQAAEGIVLSVTVSLLKYPAGWQTAENTGGAMLMKKKLTVLFLALIMVMTCAAPVCAYDAVSKPFFYGSPYTDQVKVKSAKTQAITEYVYAAYGDNNKIFKGKGECYGYAEMIRQMYGTGYKQRSCGVKATPASMYKYLKNLKPGTHVRFSKGKNGSGRAHSVVLLKISKTTIWYTDGNTGPYNAIRVSLCSLSSFAYSAARNGYSNIAWSREPKGGIPAVSKPDLKISANRNGPETHLAWRPVKKAKSYVIYRSTSKGSGYKKIATVKNTLYIDSSAGLYGKVYYKVKAVTSGKKGVTSKPAAAWRRVESPRAYLTVSGSGDSDVVSYELTWSPVPGAVKYNLYNGYTGKHIKTVYDTSWKFTDNDYNAYSLYITAEAARAKSESFPEYIYYSPNIDDMSDML